MYLITIGGQPTEPCATLAGVLEQLSRDRAPRAPVQIDAIVVRHIERGDIPVVQLGARRIGVRPAGSARSILAMILDEVEQFIVRVGGKVLRPHEMSRASWGAVVAAGRLAHYPDEALDLTAPDTSSLFQPRDLFEETGPFDIEAFIHAEFSRRFGYGTNGPAYSRDGDINLRHEVHVAYALMRGDKVRDCVVNAYRDDPAFAKNDLLWARPLVDVPALRGALSEPQLQALCIAMRSEHLQITSANVSKLLAIMRRLPTACTYVQADDALFEAGVLPPRTEPTLRAPQAESAKPVTDLAAHIRHLTTQHRFETTLAKAREEREALQISQREFDRRARAAVAERVSSSYDWANRIALAVLERNVAVLLSVLDGPKDVNTQSKRAIRDVMGVDLLQCTAALRRRRIFDMCGFSDAEQQHWEAQEAATRAAHLAKRDFEKACEQAESASWRLGNGKVLNGREYVDFCLAEGLSEIVDIARGNAREYRLRNAATGWSRRLRAKDGTLAYARARLAEVAQPEAVAA